MKEHVIKTRGRPKSNNPRGHNVIGYLKEDLYDIVMKFCEEEEISIAEFIRRSIKFYLRSINKI